MFGLLKVGTSIVCEDGGTIKIRIPVENRNDRELDLGFGRISKKYIKALKRRPESLKSKPKYEELK